MANERIIDLNSGSVNDSALAISGDPSTGTLSKVSYKQIKDYAGGGTNTTQSLADASTTTWNFANGNIAYWTIGGNHTLSITNPVPLSTGLLILTQDNTGSRVPTLPGFTGSTNFAFSTGTGSKDLVGFYYDSQNFYWSIQNYGVVSSSGGGGGGGGFTGGINFPTTSSTATFGLSQSLSNGTVWSCVSPAGYGLCDKKLAAGNDGWIQMDWFNNNSDATVLGLDHVNTLNYYITSTIQHDYVIHSYSGNYFVGSASATATWNTGQVPANGDLVRLKRTGTTITADTSSNAGATWHTIFTFPASSTGDLFLKASLAQVGAVLRYPSGSSLT